jgi:hypothetical protein
MMTKEGLMLGLLLGWLGLSALEKRAKIETSQKDAVLRDLSRLRAHRELTSNSLPATIACTKGTADLEACEPILRLALAMYTRFWVLEGQKELLSSYDNMLERVMEGVASWPERDQKVAVLLLEEIKGFGQEYTLMLNRVQAGQSPEKGLDHDRRTAPAR